MSNDELIPAVEACATLYTQRRNRPSACTVRYWATTGLVVQGKRVRLKTRRGPGGVLLCTRADVEAFLEAQETREYEEPAETPRQEQARIDRDVAEFRKRFGQPKSRAT